MSRCQDHTCSVKGQQSIADRLLRPFQYMIPLMFHFRQVSSFNASEFAAARIRSMQIRSVLYLQAGDDIRDHSYYHRP